MGHAIYNPRSNGPDMKRFTAGMRDQVVHTAPLSYFGTLIPILSTKVGDYVQEVAQTVGDLRKIELLRHRKE